MNIKYTIFLISIVLISFSPSFGQLMIKSGANIAEYTRVFETGRAPVGRRAAFHFGLTYAWPLSSKFYLEPGILYNSKGFRELENGGYNNLTYRNKLFYRCQYLELPILFKYRFYLRNSNSILGLPIIADLT